MQIDLMRCRLHLSRRTALEGVGAACDMTVKMKNQPYQPDPSKQAHQAKLYAEWLADHADELAERNSEIERASQGKNAAYAAKHRAKLLNAIPTWANLAAIERLYTEAALSGMHVDHI